MVEVCKECQAASAGQSNPSGPPQGEYPPYVHTPPPQEGYPPPAAPPPAKGKGKNPLDAAKGNIKAAAICGFVVAAITLAMTMAANAGAEFATDMGFSIWMLLDVFLVAGLSIGILFKSRVCATLMFAYYAISQVMLLVGGNGFNFMAIVFCVVFFAGMMGTYKYHTLMAANAQAAAYSQYPHYPQHPQYPQHPPMPYNQPVQYPQQPPAQSTVPPPPSPHSDNQE